MLFFPTTSPTRTRAIGNDSDDSETGLRSCNGFFAIRQVSGRASAASTINRKLNNMKRFIPNQHAAKLAKAKQMHDVLSATGADPTHYGLTAGDVTELGTLLTAAQAAAADSQNSKESKKSKTNAFSGTGQSLDQLMAKVADCGNKIRVSPASDDEVLAVGADRRKPGATPKAAPQSAPGITLDYLSPGVIYYRLHDTGNAGPRARAQNAIGAQIAVVDGTTPLTATEADKVPHVFVSRTLGQLDSTSMPSQVRLYARWQTQRGLVSPWSAPLTVKVT
jgi:hypothetical protein